MSLVKKWDKIRVTKEAQGHWATLSTLLEANG